MSTRVLNPAVANCTKMSTEMLGVSSSSSSSTQGNDDAIITIRSSGVSCSKIFHQIENRVIPNGTALARVRRDLFGPVDHEAAQALAERELRAQALLDAERWGFDFRLGVPRSADSGSRFEWQLVSAREFVPEPYALPGMNFLGSRSLKPLVSTNVDFQQPLQEASVTTKLTSTLTAEKMPAQELRTRPFLRRKNMEHDDQKQPTITDFMKSRKRMLNNSTKNVLQKPSAKIPRSTSRIRG